MHLQVMSNCSSPLFLFSSVEAVEALDAEEKQGTVCNGRALQYSNQSYSTPTRTLNVFLFDAKSDTTVSCVPILPVLALQFEGPTAPRQLL
jgi:hypothetical protein